MTDAFAVRLERDVVRVPHLADGALAEQLHQAPLPLEQLGLRDRADAGRSENDARARAALVRASDHSTAPEASNGSDGQLCPAVLTRRDHRVR